MKHATYYSLSWSVLVQAKSNEQWMRGGFGALFLTLALLSNSAHAQPWRLDQLIHKNTSLSLSGLTRIRYQSLDGQYRAGLSGSDQVLTFRTHLHAKLKLDRTVWGVEILDARQALADRDSFLSNNIVNPIDLLQAYLRLPLDSLWGDDSKSEFRAGRITMDVGSRRLVIRNGFRNTVNAFTGIDLKNQLNSGQNWRLFYVLPVDRQPKQFDRLLDNKTNHDKEDTEVNFFGVTFGTPLTTWFDHAELYYFRLNENDTHNRPSRNRELNNLGMRWLRNPMKRRFDFEIESVFQFGQSRATSAASDRSDLDHFAHFQHLSLGYSFDSPWSTRLIGELDYASGDDNPNYGENQRFDSLFGGRRFDFGPLGIYGPFARSNLFSLGWRIKFSPAADWSAFFAHRGYWLASKRDAWTTAKVVDSSGDSGSHLGQQIEARVRWEVCPGNLRWEAGAAYLFAGEFIDDAPNANGEGDASYFYTQAVFTF